MKKTNTWFIADTHFNHELMVKTRHFENIEEHDNAVADSISEYVQPGDVLCILGDFSFGGYEKHLKALRLLLDSYNRINPRHKKYTSLPYCIRLVMGNHDQNKIIRKLTKYNYNKSNDENYGIMFDSVHGSLDKIVIDRLSIPMFDSVHGSLVFNNFDESQIVCTHIPVHPINLVNGDGKRRWSANVHGHIHDYNVDDNNYICVSWEQYKRPLSLIEIQTILKKKITNSKFCVKI